MHSRQEVNEIKSTFLNQVSNQIVTCVLVIDNNLSVQYANPSAEALLIKSLYKLYGKHISKVLISKSIDIGQLELVLSTGQEFTNNDVTIEIFDGSNITIELTASFADFNDKPHILLEFKQIDYQKQITEEMFQQHQWEAARDLIKGLAHEIKNPLGGLRGAAQLLSKELTADQQEYTEMIIEQSDRLTNLVDKLLGPNQLPQMVEQNIHIVLEKVYKLVTFNNPKNINFERDYDPSIPYITFDEDKVQQAVLNIVNNAIHVLDSSGTIKLKTRVASNETINGKRIRLSIKISIIDDGPGIPESIQDTLFYPMVSGRNDGTGLGLSISQTLINQHHGKLSCKSRPGKTEFIILLPLREDN